MPISVIGSDATGTRFKEDGSTHFVNTHGAMIVLRRSLTPGQTMKLMRSSGTVANVRIVGQVGIGPAGQFYGVAFVRPQPEFWGIKFPPVGEDPEAIAKVLLECEECGSREIAQLDPIQLDVFQANDLLARHCSRCDRQTSWKQALFEPAPRRDHRLDDADAPQSSVVEEPEPELSPAERRQYVRLQLKMKACIPPPDGFGNDDVVEVLDISKGGVRFRSVRRYMVGQWLQIAVPYTHGAANIFTQARIAWRSAAVGDFIEYGLKYVRLVC